ncbi:MAG: RsmB/NOP family class I SAM-dependent RNA methyltransferase [Verrucomicrobia bacterium]|nr:RsmB/NOP family class I SAM-dependent RNA methyltransferase [Verrucomicrobiota bacterium]MBS0647140.1 RsmB/NOP family class I SAM-dependent RNA methyltransferase [Verrucomicrobiota bacterium]
MKHTFVEYHLFQLLRRFDNQHLPLDLFISQYFRAHKALGAQDRRTLAEAVYGMVRWQLLLDYLIGPNPSWEKRFQLYRNFQPTQYLTVSSIPLHVRVSCPKPLFDLLVQDYGESYACQLAQINTTTAPIMVRVNPLKTTRDALLAKWAEQYDAMTAKESPYGIEFKKRIALFALPEFQEGLFEVQDEASQLVASLVQTQPKDQVLDYCAGAGGKSLAFAHHMASGGQLYLHDVRPAILDQARKRFKRAGIQNVQFLEPGHPQLERLKGKLDWVLVDVPCSGTGTLRRHPDQKWKFTLTWLEGLIHLQRQIVEQTLPFLKPTGKLVYATCSILKKENEEQREYFLKNLPLISYGNIFQSHPAIGEKDGFFACIFQRKS